MNSKPEDWATHTVHDHKTEHWRVTALLAKDAEALWETLFEEKGTWLPEKVQNQMGILRRRLELTDYFLSGLAGSE